MEQENLGNIHKMWLRKGGIIDPIVSKDKNTINIKFIYDDRKFNVEICEEENWFVLCSDDEIVLENSKEAMGLAMELSNKAPIGFFEIKLKKDEASANKHIIKYKSHQRFIKNDDDININRTIDLHLQDHFRLFFEPISIFKQRNSDLLGSFEMAFNNY